MEELFLKLVNMSVSASWLVLAVVVLRFVLKKAPKSLRCVLWGLVGVRLVCPISIESVLSLIPSGETVPSAILYAREPAIDSGVEIINRAVNSVISDSLAPTNPGASVNPVQIWLFAAAVVWVLGMAAMGLYALVSYLRLRAKVSASVCLRENVWLCDYIDSPFILGVLRPRIYLPSAMDWADVVHVLAHERAHLKRRDHWWKPLGFLILTVYWFNPLIWLAYVLLCRDIELACDEKVIRDLGAEEKKAYSAALLSCSVPRRMIAACPLAFGEVGVKARVRSVLDYKKPAFWLMVAAVIACVVMAVCFLTDPVEKPENPTISTTGPVETTAPILVVYNNWINNDTQQNEFIEYTLSDDEADTIVNLFCNHEKITVDSPIASVATLHFQYGEDYLTTSLDSLNVLSGRINGELVVVNLSESECKEIYQIVSQYVQNNTEPEGKRVGVADGNASIYLTIPDSWEYEILPESDLGEFGVAFWPEGCEKGRVKLVFMEQGLGLCGTGLETKEVDGLPGSLGYYYDGSPIWSFLGFENAPGAYVAMTDSVEEWWGEYEDQVVEILKTAELGRGIVRMEEAICAAQNVTETSSGTWGARFDHETGVWTVKQYAAQGDSSPKMIVLVDAKGNAVDPYGWGVLLTATNVSPTGLTLNCVQSYGTARGQLMTGQPYWLEQWDGTEWEAVSEVAEEVVWTMEGWIIEKNGTTSWNVNWQRLYGEMPAGTYRIGKNISDSVAIGENETRKYYAEFEIVAPIDDEQVFADMETGEALDVIVSSDPLNSNPHGYIEACPEEYKFLTEEQPEETLRYCFEEFLKGGQTDLRGVIMGEICKDIIAQRGETVKSVYFTLPGQEWFDQYLDYAMSKSAEVSEEEMRKYYPTPWLLYSLTLRSEPKTE